MQRPLPACDNPNCIHSETSLAIKKRLCQQGVTSWIKGTGTGITRIQVAGGGVVLAQSDCKQVSGVVLIR